MSDNLIEFLRRLDMGLTDKAADEITRLRERLEQAERERVELEDLLTKINQLSASIVRKLPNTPDNTMTVVEAALALRNAQRAYMDDRGNDELGRAVASAAEVLDRALAAQKGDE